MQSKSGAAWCMIAALPALLTACGSAGSANGSSQSGMPAACLQQSPVNDSGLSDPQRDQAYQQASAAGWRCYAAWIATLDPATLPYATLPHAGMAASYGPPDGKSLSEAKADASLVVLGTVITIKPLATSFGTQATVAISQVFKGQAPSTIVVNQWSHLEPRDNFQSTWIVDATNAPLLIPGDVVFLLLGTAPVGLYQLSFTGTYYVRNGRIQALALNPFGDKVTGLSQSGFSAALTNA